MFLSLSLLQDTDLFSFISLFVGDKFTASLKTFIYADSYLRVRPVTLPPTLFRRACQGFGLAVDVPLVVCLAIAYYVAVLKLLDRTEWLQYTPSSHPLYPTKDLLTRTIVRVYESLSAVHAAMMKIFYAGSHYGLFATMTKQRDEIAVEVSVDQCSWHRLEFRYKPDSLTSPPKVIRPFYHLPRLDWVMWFLAFKPSAQLYPRWFWNFLLAILEGDDEILSLLHPSAKNLVHDLRNSLAGKEDRKSPSCISSPESSLYIRLVLLNYNFVEMKDWQRLGYWQAVKKSELLPPTQREGLCGLYEKSCRAEVGFGQSQRSSPPTVETAQQIIMKTLFKNFQDAAVRKKQQQHHHHPQQQQQKQQTVADKKLD